MKSTGNVRSCDRLNATFHNRKAKIYMSGSRIAPLNSKKARMIPNIVGVVGVALALIGMSDLSDLPFVLRLSFCWPVRYASPSSSSHGENGLCGCDDASHSPPIPFWFKSRLFLLLKVRDDASLISFSFGAPAIRDGGAENVKRLASWRPTRDGQNTVL